MWHYKIRLTSLCKKTLDKRLHFWYNAGSLKGKNKFMSLEVGMAPDGKVAFFIRGSKRGARLAESQLYAQYPEIDIECVEGEPFSVKENEEVHYLDLVLKESV